MGSLHRRSRRTLAALDVDGGGAQELIIASGTTVSAWTWASHEPGERP
jgi:hypothetical protein